ncbi:MAG: hypothetical protein IK137_01635 [Bacilli bacterium]|nr:hypothetical protein [Bacilli bacterium]
MKKFAIIEIGSYNTKTHVYEDEKIIYDKTNTLKLKANYKENGKISDNDINEIINIIKNAYKYTEDVHVYGCSIFRNISVEELNEINEKVYKECNLKIEVVTQEDEAYYTAYGCYSNIDYKDNICIFIGGGGSIELIFVKNKEIIDKKYYNFGVVDVTNKFESLKDDIPTCTFDEVYNYISELIPDINTKADLLILAGGDHFYWYNNAEYKLLDNELYKADNQNKIITIDKSDEYDKDALVTSLEKIKNNSDNPSWFDGSRAMKVITNYISHQVNAKYIIPTRINMEDGIKEVLINN